MHAPWRSPVNAWPIRIPTLSAPRELASKPEEEAERARAANVRMRRCLVGIDPSLEAKFAPEFECEDCGVERCAGCDAEATRRFEDAARRVGQCSEQMLTPDSALIKGALYAEHLEKWGSRATAVQPPCNRHATAM